MIPRFFLEILEKFSIISHEKISKIQYYYYCKILENDRFDFGNGKNGVENFSFPTLNLFQNTALFFYMSLYSE